MSKKQKQVEKVRKVVQLILFWVLPLLIGSVCQAEDITIRYNGSSAKVSQSVKDSVTVKVKGANVYVESLYKDHKLTLRVTGQSNDGQLLLKTAGKAKVRLEGLQLTSQEGAPLELKNKKKVEVVAAKGTENTLTVTACNDTVNHKAAVVWAKDKLLLSGKGTLNIVATGDGCRGIKTKKDITVEELTLNVSTSGNHLGEKPFEMGGFPPFGNDSTMRDKFPPFGNDSTMRGGFPDFGKFPPFGNDSLQAGPPGGFGGKHKYISSANGIASKGKITFNSGCVTVRTTTAGAEGIEGKEGIIFNGGSVDVQSPDDAINANAVIEFNGSHVVARSTGNDAVDANPQGGFFPPFGGGGQNIDPVIIIRGGTVYAWSQVGSPEEGLDCDFAPLAIEGGTVFSVGGGMGEMPSVPTNASAKQPTVLLIGLPVVKDEPVFIYDGSGKLLDTVTVPFSMQRSASIVSHPAFKVAVPIASKRKGMRRPSR